MRISHHALFLLVGLSGFWSQPSFATPIGGGGGGFCTGEQLSRGCSVGEDGFCNVCPTPTPRPATPPPATPTPAPVTYLPYTPVYTVTYTAAPAATPDPNAERDRVARFQSLVNPDQSLRSSRAPASSGTSTSGSGAVAPLDINLLANPGSRTVISPTVGRGIFLPSP